MMKILIFTFCLFGPMRALSQTADTSKIRAHKNGSNSSIHPITADEIRLPATLYKIDGLELTSNNNIKPADIFSVTIMKPNDELRIYGIKTDSGAIIITTKAFAKKLYQQKLSPFSKKYAAYMASHGDDSKLLYVINNTMLIAGTNRTLRELSDLEADNIKDVSFKRDSRYASDATVIITTKDYIKTADEK